MRMEYVARPYHAFIVIIAPFLIFDTTNGLSNYDALCRISKDPVYHGIKVDCSAGGLSVKDLRTLHFYNATTLFLSNNNFGLLPNDSFLKFQQLKHLVCQTCSLYKVEVDALKGLEKLEILDLTFNHLALKTYSYPRGFFRHVTNLQRLYIGFNDNHGTSNGYSQYIDIFKFGRELRYLSIDSFDNLTIGEEFLSFTQLDTLEVVCIKSIQNNSLEGFQLSRIKTFVLSYGHIDESQLGLDVFQFLPNVSTLSLKRLRVGNLNALRMMKHLKGRQIETIRLEKVQAHHFSYWKQRMEDSTVTAESLQNLLSINVSNFYWYSSGLYAIDVGAMFSSRWNDCLQTIIVETDTMIVGNNIDLFKMMLMKKLRFFQLLQMDNKVISNFWDGPNMMDADCDGEIKERPTKSNKRLEDISNYVDKHSFQNIIHTRKPFYKTNCSKQVGRDLKKDHVMNDTRLNIFNTIGRVHLVNKSNIMMDGNYFKPTTDVNKTHLEEIVFALPPSLESLRIDNIHVLHIDKIYRLTYNHVLSAITLSNTGKLSLQGKLYGAEHISEFNAQGSKLQNVAVDFFDTFPTLQKLSLRRITSQYFVPDNLQSNLKRLVHHLPALEYLDIAENGLSRLAGDVFHSNKKLKYLCLADNRFSSIPFSVKMTPNLEVLDLRTNSLVMLSVEERAAIDHHITKITNFTVLMDDNSLACSCSALAFIAWLLDHAEHFDKSANYPCISEDGTISRTASHHDITAFWRRCYGFNFLMVSLALFCLLIAGYLAAFLAIKNKTQIISKIQQTIVPGFRLQTRNDFYFDVFIGCSNSHDDANFIRMVLMRYLEERTNLKTFFHHRDQLQDAQMQFRALKNSWRCLLVITEEFLHNYDMAHNIMMVASSSLTSSNPRHVVVMVDERAQHQIPDYLLQVVVEDNILVVPDFRGPLDYETKEFLKTRLLD